MPAEQQSQGKVLVLDSDQERSRDLCSRLRYLNYEPVTPGEATLASLCENGIAAVLGNPDEGHSLLELRKLQPGLPLLCLPGSVSDAAGLQGEACWALEMPLKKSQLTRLLRRAERYQGCERRHRLTGQSTSIREVRQLIEQVADFDTNVLITGQSGTGKELVARTVHDLSARADRPFVPINCGAIPAELLESELFGHKKGAFTGAISDRTGRFELAQGGTLFLDEIGDMSLDMQVKLLRVLQERSFERVGCNKTQVCDVRIVAATHRDLAAAVAAGEFREDLYYRLNVFPIEMPPLYKRVSDLPLLLRELLLRHDGAQGGQQPDGLRVSPAALQSLAAYDWPGNIRELSNLVERLAIVKPVGTIELDDLPAKYRQAVCTASDASPELPAAGANLKEHLQGVEQELIKLAFESSGGVVARAAELLNMQRTTLVEKIRKYAIH